MNDYDIRDAPRTAQNPENIKKRKHHPALAWFISMLDKHMIDQQVTCILLADEVLSHRSHIGT